MKKSAIFRALARPEILAMLIICMAWGFLCALGIGGICAAFGYKP